jgi:hypothetical protein
MIPALATLTVTLAEAVPSPSPTSRVPDELEVTPGLEGFLVTFAVAAAAVLLFLSLTRHLRRARHNAIELGLPVDEPRRHRPDGEGPASVQSPDVGPVDGPEAPGTGRSGRDDERGPAGP